MIKTPEFYDNYKQIWKSAMKAIHVIFDFWSFVGVSVVWIQISAEHSVIYLISNKFSLLTS